jgi:hypothetical protein
MKIFLKKGVTPLTKSNEAKKFRGSWLVARGSWLVARGSWRSVRSCRYLSKKRKKVSSVLPKKPQAGR